MPILIQKLSGWLRFQPPLKGSVCLCSLQACVASDNSAIVLRTSDSESGRMIAAGSLQCPLGASELPTMSSQSQILASSSQFESIPETASREYEKKTGNGLLDHWLSEEIQSCGCDSVEAVLDIRQDQTETVTFDTFRNGDKRLMKWIGSPELQDFLSSRCRHGTYNS